MVKDFSENRNDSNVESSVIKSTKSVTSTIEKPIKQKKKKNPSLVDHFVVSCDPDLKLMDRFKSVGKVDRNKLAAYVRKYLVLITRLRLLMTSLYEIPGYSKAEDLIKETDLLMQDILSFTIRETDPQKTNVISITQKKLDDLKEVAVQLKEQLLQYITLGSQFREQLTDVKVEKEAK